MDRNVLVIIVFAFLLLAVSAGENKKKSVQLANSNIAFEKLQSFQEIMKKKGQNTKIIIDSSSDDDEIDELDSADDELTDENEFSLDLSSLSDKSDQDESDSLKLDSEKEFDLSDDLSDSDPTFFPEDSSDSDEDEQSPRVKKNTPMLKKIIILESSSSSSDDEEVEQDESSSYDEQSEEELPKKPLKPNLLNLEKEKSKQLNEKQLQIQKQNEQEKQIQLMKEKEKEKEKEQETEKQKEKEKEKEKELLKDNQREKEKEKENKLKEKQKQQEVEEKERELVKQKLLELEKQQKIEREKEKFLLHNPKIQQLESKAGKKEQDEQEDSYDGSEESDYEEEEYDEMSDEDDDDEKELQIILQQKQKLLEKEQELMKRASQKQQSKLPHEPEVLQKVPSQSEEFLKMTHQQQRVNNLAGVSFFIQQQQTQSEKVEDIALPLNKTSDIQLKTTSEQIAPPPSPSKELNDALNQIKQLHSQMQNMVGSHSNTPKEVEIQSERLNSGQKDVIREAREQVSNMPEIIMPSSTIQQLEEQVITQVEYEVEEGKVECDSSSAAKEACNLCKSNQAYQLDEDNWYLIGLTHGYKKEFQWLLDSIKEKLGDSGTYFLSFSAVNNVCLSSWNLSQDLDLEDVIAHFTSRKVHEFQMKDPIFEFPSKMQGKSFVVKSIYDSEKRTFNYKQFRLSTQSEFIHQVLQNGLIVTREIEFIEENATVKHSGVIKYSNSEMEFSLEFGNSMSMLSVKNLVIPEYRDLVLAISERYFGPYFKDAIAKHIKNEQNKHHATLQIGTFVKGQKFQIHFNLQKEEES